ncbi:YqaI family protein [Bacillus velezensis]|uniref:YqaI family protein n=1 Tax=Bacillus velezensis TaxID=492670 RepID=UPI0030ED1C3F
MVENPIVINNWHDNLTETDVRIDFYGDEVTSVDDYVIDGGEIILRENLERYLKEQLGFEFKNAQ